MKIISNTSVFYLDKTVPNVTVNHGGSIVTCDPLDFNGKDHIALGEDTEPNFTGQEVSFGQFMTGDYDNDMTLS